MCHLLTSDYFEMSSHGQPISVFKGPVSASVYYFLYYGDFVKTDALCDGRCEVGDWTGNAFSDIFLSLFFFKNLCSK